jgi:hypothetical protein
MSRAFTDLLSRETLDAVIVTTPAGKVLYWNNEAEGGSVHEVRGEA